MTVKASGAIEVEDEAFHLIEGELVASLGERSWNVFLLQITSPAQFECFVAEVGEHAIRRGLPEPGPIDVDESVASANRHHIQISPGGGRTPAPRPCSPSFSSAS